MDNNRLNESVVIGRNAIRELLKTEKDVDKIYVQRGGLEGAVKAILAMAAEKKIPILEVDKAKLDFLSEKGAHQGIIAVTAEHNYATLEQVMEYADSKGENPFIVICDGIEDPHNLGAVIRSAECSGVHGVIIPKRRAVGLTHVVAKSSAGALEHMRVVKVTNLASTVEQLKKLGFWIYAADMGGENYFQVDYSGSVAVVFGSEGFGISRIVKEKSDFVVSIPMHGEVNSMNVSCAAAVILTEVSKQRHFKGGR